MRLQMKDRPLPKRGNSERKNTTSNPFSVSDKYHRVSNKHFENVIGDRLKQPAANVATAEPRVDNSHLAPVMAGPQSQLVNQTSVSHTLNSSSV